MPLYCTLQSEGILRFIKGTLEPNFVEMPVMISILCRTSWHSFVFLSTGSLTDPFQKL
jgi:hypothetical protein